MSRPLTLVLGLLFLAACRAKTPPPAGAATPGSSPNTKVLQAVELTPYAGAPVKKNVESVIDANAKHNQDLQNLAEPKD